jgi:PRTRC genetic system protein B
MTLLTPLTDGLPPLIPQSALVFHTRGSNALELLTLHQIRDVRGKPTLVEGTPLSPEDEQAILTLLTSSDTATAQIELNPANLLFSDRHQIVWCVPGVDRPMHFNETGKRTQRTVKWPSLIFRVVEHRLFLAAYHGTERPTLDTPLYKAPLANIWSSAEVCTGNAILPEASRISEMSAWESVIFDTAFSHANDHEVIRSSRSFTDPMEFWKKNDAIEPKQLVPLSKGATLGQWLTSPAIQKRGAHRDHF